MSALPSLLYGGSMQDILDMTVPIVVETSGRTERAYDIFSRLLKDRIVLLGSEVNDAVASLICAQLLFLESQDPEKEIYLYINSPGGSVTSGMAIYDTMRYLKCEVSTTSPRPSPPCAWAAPPAWEPSSSARARRVCATPCPTAR